MTKRHVMGLNEYARLAGRREWPPLEMGLPTLVSPPLVDALDRLIESAADVAERGGSTRELSDALAGLRALHDFETVRLGGERRP